MRIEEIAALKAQLKQGIAPEMLFDHMLRKYRQKRDARTFWQAPTVETWQEERRRLKTLFEDMFSPFPARCDLAPRVTAVRQRDGYRMECVCYQVSPGVIATANLYVPDHAAPGATPALVLACGHAETSKAYYRFVAEEAVKAGLMTLCFDPTGQGERHESWNYLRWQPRTDGMEHDRLGELALLMGGNMAGVFAFDCMRAVDYLLTRPEVDGERIGFMGASGGGMQTTWAATLDERIAVACPCCFITSIDQLLNAREPSDSEQNPPGMLAEGLEYCDFLGMMAPKPVLILGTEEDFFPIGGAVETLEALKRLYTAYGVPERVALTRAPGGHAGRGLMMTAGIAWLCQWFGLPVPVYQVEDMVRKEEEVKELDSVSEDTYAVGGQMMCLPEITGYWRYYRSCIRALEPRPLDRSALRRTLAATLPSVELPIERRFEQPHAGGILYTADDIAVPWLYAKAGSAPSKTLCVLSHEDGMLNLLAPGREMTLLLEAGIDVLAFDPRGVGVTRGRPRGWWASRARRFLAPLNEECVLQYHVLGYVDPLYEGVYATGHEMGMHGLKLNSPLLGQRVTDALGVLARAEELTGRHYEKLTVYGAGYSAAWMLYAVLLTEQPIAACAFHSLLTSYKLIAELPEHRYLLEHLARGLLLTGDIPQALQALACPAMVVDPMDAMRFPADERIAEGALVGCGAQVLYTRGEQNPLACAVEFLKKQ